MRALLFLVTSLILTTRLCSYHYPPPTPAYASFLSSMPPRFQWNTNHGYCGEVCLISAGLKYGQYVSQYAARETILGPDGEQSTKELLLGKNDQSAAEAMHLAYAQWNDADSKRFLTWIKAYVLNGYPVMIGVYMNECWFYNRCDHPKHQGHKEYDHIVPVLGIISSEPTSPPPSLFPLPSYLESDIIVLSDNGLQGPFDNPIHPPELPNPANQYRFSYFFNRFLASRKEANTNHQWYSLSRKTNTYGIAILGVKDLHGDTIPVTVTTNCSAGYINYEYPSIEDQTNTQPKPMPLSLTVTVSIPDPNQEYILYRYDALTNIPDEKFNAQKGTASQTWMIPKNSGDSFVIVEEILSNEVAAYRAVASTAP